MIIKQRNNSDCAVCTLAMALGIRYEDVLELVPEYQKRSERGEQIGLTIPDYLYVMRLHGFSIEAVYPHSVNKYFGVDFWDHLTHKLAFLVVHSLNYPGRLHSVFWDGDGVRDPSFLLAYDSDSIKNDGAVKYGLIIEPIISRIDFD